jgi:crotonobetainyl-CoA:carnitine CoA-transferase CaiB-like acyl-CoA transferase
MYSIDDILADEHLAAIGYFTEAEHPSEGRMRSVAVPTEWSKSPPAITRHAPLLGENTAEVLREAGYSEADVQALASAGVIGLAG